MGMPLGSKSLNESHHRAVTAAGLLFIVLKKCSVTELSVNFHPCLRAAGSKLLILAS